MSLCLWRASQWSRWRPVVPGRAQPGARCTQAPPGGDLIKNSIAIVLPKPPLAWCPAGSAYLVTESSFHPAEFPRTGAIGSSSPRAKGAGTILAWVPKNPAQARPWGLYPREPPPITGSDLVLPSHPLPASERHRAGGPVGASASLTSTQKLSH